MKMNTVFLPILLIAAVTVSQGQSAGICGVIPIVTWGEKPLNRVVDLVKPVKIVVVQHTVTKECSADDDCEKAVRNIRDFQRRLGFDDIAQSFMVGGNGKIYEGAGWKRGAHTLGYNDRAISVSFIGDFREKLPTAEALQSAQEFLKCSANNKDLDSNYKLFGHLQLSATLSPGAALQSLIETWPHWQSEISNL